VVAHAYEDDFDFRGPLIAGRNDMVQALTIAGLLIAGAGVLLARRYAHRLTRPIADVGRVLDAVAAGDLELRVDYTADDEIGRMAAHLNGAIDSMSEVSAALTAVAAGQLDVEIDERSERDQLAKSTRVLLGAQRERAAQAAELQETIAELTRAMEQNETLRLELVRREAAYRELAESSPDVIWRFARTPTPHMSYVNHAFERLTGLTAAEVETDLSRFVSLLDASTRAILADAVAGRPVPSRFDSRFLRADGTEMVVELRVTEVAGGFQGAGRDVTEVRALEALLAQQARRDPLTGLANRRLVHELLAQAVPLAQRHGNALVVAFLDLDDFKAVNDTYGHDAGDHVLRTTAHRLQELARASDIVGRYGGDEFVVAFEVETPDDVEHIVDRFSVLDDWIDLGDGVVVRCPASVGIADTVTAGTDPAELIAAADRAMYEAKRTRRARSVRLAAGSD
jgi:diguanylate cyclase (GGDEF)-like protein/PAS domain S-box-containing protein